MSEEKYVYVCGVDWQHELGEASGGNKVYPSVEDLKRHVSCWVDCGIVKIKMSNAEWVFDQSRSFNRNETAAEETLCLIKPDITHSMNVGHILQMLGKRFKIHTIKTMQMSETLAKLFYKEHEDAPFFKRQIDFMTSGPVIAVILRGYDVIKRYQEIMGNTDPEKAKKDTIRGRFGTNLPRNAVHGSDSCKSAEKEIQLIFGNDKKG